MTKTPDQRQTTDYEWVVEQISEDGSGDIIECFYWSEDELAQALQCFRTTANPDFGLCRRQGSEVDGETDRQYAYADTTTPEWTWPAEFEYGARIPQRLVSKLPKSA